ncbi:MAG: hypothetical protein HOP18_02590 [Deltaproteobacteria bacterium]|nr:hypothetical protein [Deltaproteobacteria bacterium]
MTWRRLGLLFRPERQFDWMQSHAANPFAEQLDGDLYRMYFSCRDAHNRSSIGFVDCSLRTLTVQALCNHPVLSPGATGTFDDSGVSVGCIVQDGPVRYLYYMGWNLAVTVPWRNSIGLALSHDGGPFVKHTLAPILDRNRFDPYSLSYPWVRKEPSRWRMWYGSQFNWGTDTRVMEHVIKHAASGDGIQWDPTDTVCLPVLTEESSAYARPCILMEQGVYKMWFSYRGKHYRLGYAESVDGIQWRRMDEKGGLEPSGTGWDSNAVAYAHVFDHDGQRYAVYCGNGYGRTGFGLAVQEAP